MIQCRVRMGGRLPSRLGSPVTPLVRAEYPSRRKKDCFLWRFHYCQLCCQFVNFVADLAIIMINQLADNAVEFEQLGQHLLIARKSANLTQRQLALRTGIDTATINRIERSQRRPTLDQLL